MTIKKLKEMIADLPDNMRIYSDDGTDFFKGNSEFVCIAVNDEDNMAVLQTVNDIDVIEETKAALEYFSKNDWNELDAMIEMVEMGYQPEDFPNPEWAREFMEDHGLI